MQADLIQTKRTTGRRDAIVIVLGCAIAIGAVVLFGMPDPFVHWVHAQEQWGFDELLSVSLVSVLGFMLYAQRRRAELLHEIDERTQAQEALRASEAHFRLMVEGVTDYAIVRLGPEGDIVSWSTAAERIKGYEPTEILGRHFSIFYPLEDVDQGKPADQLRLVRTEGRCEDEGWRVRRDGSRFWANVVITALRDDTGRLVGFAKVTRDATERKQTEERLAYQAFHDSLTGLANRALFHDRLVQALERATHRQQPVTVLFLDLDNFKAINDSLGHAAGDQVLVAVAERLLHSTRGADSVARLGGDEFAILLDGARMDQEAVTVVERITRALQRPIIVEAAAVVVAASIGVASATDGDGPDELLRKADAAMYTAKIQAKTAPTS